MITHHEDGRCWTEFTLGPVYEGPPGLVHGGICALLLDQLLGEAATSQLSKPKFTGTITLRYLRGGTPLGRCAARRGSNEPKAIRPTRADSSATQKDRP